MNPSTAQATVLVDELIRNGVRHVVLCPGSRNAPLSFALHEAAAAGRLALHVRVDERSAGFLALGLARGGAGVTAVTCTSGTAVANLHPALLEARHARVPVIALTADRPVELYRTGASQTVDQQRIFGLDTLQFPIAERRGHQNGLWRSLVCRAVATAGEQGPVHVNVPFREPLVPDRDADWPEDLDGRPFDMPWTRAAPRATTSLHPADHLGPRTLVVIGDTGRESAGRDHPDRDCSAGNPFGGDFAGRDSTGRDRVDRDSIGPGSTGPGSAGPDFAGMGTAGVDCGGGRNITELAERAGWPVIAEPTAHGLRHGTLLLNAGDLPAHLTPQAVVVVGRATLSRGVLKLIARTPVVHVLSDDLDWPDPRFAATHASTGLVLGEHEVDHDWLPAWQHADKAVADAVDDLLAREPWPTGLHVARDVVAALPVGANLFLGSSNPVRDVDLVAAPRRDVRTFSNRGAAGIDGSVSTAAGIALTRGPTYALIGDLTFLHDANGLLIGPHEPRPDLTIVVLNDDGGGIFALLEQGAKEHERTFERVFGTPHGVDLAALCAAHHVRHVEARSPDDLRRALGRPAGISVVEVRAERSGLRDLHARLRAAVSTAPR